MSVKIGSRIKSLDGFFGTVRYVGNIDGLAGDWFGVEWDDAQRGTNDGTVNGKCYFECTRPGKAASFLRCNKIHNPHSFESAVESHFRSIPEEGVFDPHLGGDREGDMLIFGQKHHAHGPNRFHAVRNLVLCDSAISHISLTTGDLARFLPSLTDLDVSQNLFSDWSSILTLISGLPSLCYLNASRNYLGEFSDEIARQFEGVTFPSTLQCLVLNHMKLNTSTSICNLLSTLFNRRRGSPTAAASAPHVLKELYIMSNQLKSINFGPISEFVQVRSLFANQNEISDWSDGILIGLRGMTELKSLVLVGNPLVDTQVPDPPKTPFLPSLTALNLSETLLSNTASLQSLILQFPALRDLRINHAPLSGDQLISALLPSGGAADTSEPDDPLRLRKFLIGLLPGITTLNGGGVSEKEREDSERFFIRLFKDSAERIGISLPPRYHELIKIHGDLAPLADVQIRPPGFVSVYVIVDGAPPVETFVNLSWKVLELKKKLTSEFSTAATGGEKKKFRIYYMDRDMFEVVGLQELRVQENSRFLSSIGVKEHDEFVMDSV